MKPILFNTDMVRAILDGRKTVTRRVAKLPSNIKPQGKELYTLHTEGTCYENQRIEDIVDYLKPPCKVNDVLYVREAWHKYTKRVGKGFECRLQEFYGYKASVANSEDANTPWKPSIHMPKEAARLFLRVTGVRVERLQDITEEQAEAEGIRGYTKDGKLYKYAVNTDWWLNYHYKQRKIFKGSWWQDMPRTAKEAFHHLWNSTLLGKKDTPEWYANNWSGNPYVWVIEFEVIPADQAQGN